MKQEYDFSEGVRGKYFKRYQAGSNVVILDPEIAKVFKDSASVNDALRSLIRAAGRTQDSAPDAQGAPQSVALHSNSTHNESYS